MFTCITLGLIVAVLCCGLVACAGEANETSAFPIIQTATFAPPSNRLVHSTEWNGGPVKTLCLDFVQKYPELGIGERMFSEMFQQLTAGVGLTVVEHEESFDATLSLDFTIEAISADYQHPFLIGSSPRYTRASVGGELTFAAAPQSTVTIPLPYTIEAPEDCFAKPGALRCSTPRRHSLSCTSSLPYCHQLKEDNSVKKSTHVWS